MKLNYAVPTILACLLMVGCGQDNTTTAVRLPPGLEVTAVASYRITPGATGRDNGQRGYVYGSQESIEEVKARYIDVWQEHGLTIVDKTDSLVSPAFPKGFVVGRAGGTPCVSLDPVVNPDQLYLSFSPLKIPDDIKSSVSKALDEYSSVFQIITWPCEIE